MITVRVRCIKSKQGVGKWLLKGGETYEAKIDGEQVSIINHYEEVIEMDLKEFNYRCKIIKKLS